MGDIFSCVAHYANHTTVVEGAAMYCPDIIARVRSSTKISVRCPELYPTRGHIDADLFYFWMQPKLSLTLLKSLRNGVKAGQVRPTSVFAVTTFPLASRNNKTEAKPVYIWLTWTSPVWHREHTSFSLRKTRTLALGDRATER